MAEGAVDDDLKVREAMAAIAAMAIDNAAIKAAVERIEADEGLQVKDIGDAVGAGLERIASRLDATVASVTRKSIEGAIEKMRADDARVTGDGKAHGRLLIGVGAVFGAATLIVLMKLLPTAWLAGPVAVTTFGGAIPAAEAMLDRASPGEQRNWQRAQDIYGLYGDQLAVCAADAKRHQKTVKCPVVVDPRHPRVKLTVTQ